MWQAWWSAGSEIGVPEDQAAPKSNPDYDDRSQNFRQSQEPNAHLVSEKNAGVLGWTAFVQAGAQDGGVKLKKTDDGRE